MATLHSSLFSMRLTYDLKVYPWVAGTEWHFYYIIEPLLYDQPFLRPNVLKRWKQPHGTFLVLNASNHCEISNWLKEALHGGNNKWCSLEPPELELQLMQDSHATSAIQTRFSIKDQGNPNDNERHPNDAYLLQWSFHPAFFTGSKEVPNCFEPFVMQQSVTRQQLEHFFGELKQELTMIMQANGLEL